MELTQQTGKVWIGRAKQGDTQAMDALIHLNRDRVYRFAFRLCGEHNLASDITAEAFVRAFRALPTFREESELSTWLYRIVFNAYLDEKKRLSKVPTDSLQSDGGGGIETFVSAPGDLPDESLLWSMRRTRLNWALQQLGPKQRDVVVYYHVDGYTYEEIADRCRLPIGTVKSRLNRARQSLLFLLGGDKELLLA